MSVQRRPPGPIRQLSLQPPARRQQIRRQRSADEEKTFQIYTNPIRGRFNTTVAKSDMIAVERPKVRIAWGEQSPKTKESLQVEVVARQISSAKSNRQPSAKDFKSSSNKRLIGDKATILYSRQELAERLRLAWQQREENKSNIDIFLAHNTVEERCDSQLSSCTISSTPHLLDDHQVSSADEDDEDKEIYSWESVDLQTKDIGKVPPIIDPEPDNHHREIKNWFPLKETEDSKRRLSKRVESVEEVKEDSHSSSQILCEPVIKNGPPKETENQEGTKKKCISIECNYWKNSPIESHPDLGSTRPPPAPIAKDDFSQAKLKRAGFQSGTNKAFVGPIVEKTINLKVSEKTNCKINSLDFGFRRTNSAPPQRRTTVNIVIDTPTIKSDSLDVGSSDTIKDKKDSVLATTSNEEVPPLVKTSTITNRPIKSAPVKRRTKSSKRRGLSIGYGRGMDEDTNKIRNRGAKGKGASDTKNSDVITMVSLVSSADSESEIDEGSPRDDQLICELRSKLPTTPIIKTSASPTFAARKPIKSVSFQQDSFDSDILPRTDVSREEKKTLQPRFMANVNRVNNCSVTSASIVTDELTIATSSILTSWKSEVSCLALPLLQLPSEVDVAIETPLTDREKRCLAVPIGDIRDKKRKLLRSRSTTIIPRTIELDKPTAALTERVESCLQPQMQSQMQETQVSNASRESTITKAPVNTSIPSKNADTEINSVLSSEPHFQTPKEKECWHLYRRMCDKGVFVSFDTVLRGMLTPTEYRLRQKELSQNC